MRKLQLKALLLSLCLVFSLLCYADTLDTQLSSDKVAVGETFTITFTSNNSNGAKPDFSLLEKDFRIINTDYGNAVSMVNGVTSNKTFWQLTLEAKKTGVVQIPEIPFGNAKSVPQKLTVSEPSSHTVNTQDDSSTFVAAEVSTSTPYLQSQVLYTFKLFYQTPVENPILQLPEVKDAVYMQMGSNQYQTQVKGKPYYVMERSFAIFPQKAGKLLIAPARFRAITYDNNAFDNSFYVKTPKSIVLATQAFTLDVVAPPSSFPGTTWLPAKNISLTEKWSVDPDKREAGNPVTRTITVEAQGLRGDQLPDLAIEKIEGANIYIDPPQRNNDTQNNMVIGTLVQKVTYIPNSSKAVTIPGIKLPWWNLQTNSNAVAQLTSIVAQVAARIPDKASSAMNQLAPASNSPVTPVIKNPVPINTPAFYKSIWFWVAAFLFLVWLITLWLIMRKRQVKDISPNPDVNKELSTELNEENFEKACKQGNPVLAQQFLLAWAKKQWQNPPANLEKLNELSNNENLKLALKNLEHVMYAKQGGNWNGAALLTAYRNFKKQRPALGSKATEVVQDSLPPLHPASGSAHETAESRNQLF